MFFRVKLNLYLYITSEQVRAKRGGGCRGAAAPLTQPEGLGQLRRVAPKLGNWGDNIKGGLSTDSRLARRGSLCERSEHRERSERDGPRMYKRDEQYTFE